MQANTYPKTMQSVNMPDDENSLDFELMHSQLVKRKKI